MESLQEAGVCGDHVTAFKGRDARGPETLCHAARLLDEQKPGGHIPGLEPELEKAIQPAGGHRGQVEGRGTRPPDAGNTGQERAELFQVGRKPAEVPEREAGPDEGVFQTESPGDPDAAIVEECPFAPARDVEFIPAGVIDHPGFENPAMFESEGDGIDRESVEEVGRSVQGIHDPAVLAPSLRRIRKPAFLREDGVIRVGGADHLDNGGLCGPVDLAHEIVGCLFLNPDPVEPVGLAADDLAGPAGGPDGDLDDGLHGRGAGRRWGIIAEPDRRCSRRYNAAWPLPRVRSTSTTPPRRRPIRG